jgi:hypothetical protein
LRGDGDFDEFFGLASLAIIGAANLFFSVMSLFSQVLCIMSTPGDLDGSAMNPSLHAPSALSSQP